MAWEYQCPHCDFAASGNEERAVVEDAQQHGRDAHGDTPTREEVEQHLVGPG